MYFIFKIVNFLYEKFFPLLNYFYRIIKFLILEKK
jgi:hypothetical protein